MPYPYKPEHIWNAIALLIREDPSAVSEAGHAAHQARFDDYAARDRALADAQREVHRIALIRAGRSDET